MPYGFVGSYLQFAVVVRVPVRRSLGPARKAVLNLFFQFSQVHAKNTEQDLRAVYSSA